MCCLAARAQGNNETQAYFSTQEIEGVTEEISNYLNEVSAICADVAGAKSGNVGGLERRMQSVDIRWKAYQNLEQDIIAATPNLMSMLSQYQLLYNITADSIAAQKKRLMAMDDFKKALAAIIGSSGKYDVFESDAGRFSMLPQTAKQLAEVKAQEQLLFQQLTASYQSGLQACLADPGLGMRKAELEKAYIALQVRSQGVQAMVYKPFVQRIKDYVLTFAGVAILIMFVTMLIAKIKALKAARDAAKKYTDQFGNHEYPTI